MGLVTVILLHTLIDLSCWSSVISGLTSIVLNLRVCRRLDCRWRFSVSCWIKLDEMASKHAPWPLAITAHKRIELPYFIGRICSVSRMHRILGWDAYFRLHHREVFVILSGQLFVFYLPLLLDFVLFKTFFRSQLARGTEEWSSQVDSVGSTWPNLDQRVHLAYFFHFDNKNFRLV